MLAGAVGSGREGATLNKSHNKIKLKEVLCKITPHQQGDSFIENKMK